MKGAEQRPGAAGSQLSGSGVRAAREGCGYRSRGRRKRVSFQERDGSVSDCGPSESGHSVAGASGAEDVECAAQWARFWKDAGKLVRTQSEDEESDESRSAEIESSDAENPVGSRGRQRRYAAETVTLRGGGRRSKETQKGGPSPGRKKAPEGPDSSSEVSEEVEPPEEKNRIGAKKCWKCGWTCTAVDRGGGAVCMRCTPPVLAPPPIPQPRRREQREADNRRR